MSAASKPQKPPSSGRDDTARSRMLERCKACILEWAHESGQRILDYWNRGFQVDYKADATPVTEADREVEIYLRKCIQTVFPGHGIIGEEFGGERVGGDWVWVIDPIDGTKSFVSRIPLFGTLIGLLHCGEPVLGLIHQPVLQQLCIGDGHTTLRNGRPVTVRDCASSADAVLLTSGLETFCGHPSAPGWQRLISATRVSRTWGDCYGYMMVASGEADIMVDPVLNPWDILPLIPVIRGAGGIITAWDGGDPVTGSSAVAAGPSLHRQVLNILREPASPEI